MITPLYVAHHLRMVSSMKTLRTLSLTLLYPAFICMFTMQMTDAVRGTDLATSSLYWNIAKIGGAGAIGLFVVLNHRD